MSLCLHSGPTWGSELHWNPIWPNELQLLQILVGRSAAGSWLGTGDALLEHPKVWSDFHSHFSQGGMDRTHQWRTVLMPHHGSGSGGNFNSKLLEGPVCNAVFSVGALNKYRHPARRVLEAVADMGAASVVVTEHRRPGFFEQLTFSVR